MFEKIKNAPSDPGCYLFKDKNSKIIYIGKAKNLNNRVRSYFIDGKTRDIKTQAMVGKIHDVEFITTNTEVEALILENSLVKKYRPKYNILLRDDKTFPYICITKEPFPRVYYTRKINKGKNKYFGPYTDSGALKATLKLLKKIFPVRNCSLNLNETDIDNGKFKICLNFHINKCEGPCMAHISRSEYQNMINKVEAFLNGNTNEVIEFFHNKMNNASSELLFEDAARYRDYVNVLKNYSNRQAVDFLDLKNRDLIFIISEAENGCAVLFRIRKGKLIAKDTFFIEGVIDKNPDEIMRNFIQQYYNKVNYIPEEILVNEYPADEKIIIDWLSKNKKKRVRILKPDREEKLRLLKMAERNCRLKLDEFIAKKAERKDYTPKTLEKIKKDLLLPKLPRRIEAFDISNIKGKYAVGSLVSFVNAKPKKSEYRRFKIKTVKGINDFAMMEEVITRRYTRVLKENLPLPDLILIDGGKGQLSSAKSVLDKLNLDNVAVAGLAKRLEEIFLPGETEPILLPKDSISLILLQRLRDESHRFAITYHRKLRGKGEVKSQLDDIPGLGKLKKQQLWLHFKTISKMTSAGIEDLCQVEGIGPKLAKTIRTCLHERK